MQLLGLILLIASSWYIWKLTDKFLDEETKQGFNNDFENFKSQFRKTLDRFSSENLNRVWEKYKEEGTNSDKDQDSNLLKNSDNKKDEPSVQLNDDNKYNSIKEDTTNE